MNGQNFFLTITLPLSPYLHRTYKHTCGCCTEKASRAQLLAVASKNANAPKDWSHRRNEQPDLCSFHAGQYRMLSRMIHYKIRSMRKLEFNMYFIYSHTNRQQSVAITIQYPFGFHAFKRGILTPKQFMVNKINAWYDYNLWVTWVNLCVFLGVNIIISGFKTG